MALIRVTLAPDPMNRTLKFQSLALDSAPKGHREKRGALAGAVGRATMVGHHSYELVSFVFLLSSVISQRAYECRPA